MYGRRQCVVCKKIQAISKDFYILINSNECENKLRAEYRFKFRTDLPDQSLINSYVHKNCYIKVTRKRPEIKRKKNNRSQKIISTGSKFLISCRVDKNYIIGKSVINWVYGEIFTDTYAQVLSKNHVTVFFSMHMRIRTRIWLFTYKIYNRWRKEKKELKMVLMLRW
jgi:hypothetical protein